MGKEVIVDVVSDSPVLHQKKKLEVEVLKALHARIDEKLQVTINLTVEAPETPETTLLRGKAIDGIQHVWPLRPEKAAWASLPSRLTSRSRWPAWASKWASSTRTSTGLACL